MTHGVLQVARYESMSNVKSTAVDEFQTQATQALNIAYKALRSTTCATATAPLI